MVYRTTKNDLYPLIKGGVYGFVKNINIRKCNRIFKVCFMDFEEHF